MMQNDTNVKRESIKIRRLGVLPPYSLLYHEGHLLRPKSRGFCYNDTMNELPEIPPTRADDIHNLDWMEEADLLLFMAGNQFMAMEELLFEFRQENPHIKKIFYETLPPGLELKQILSGGALFRGKVLTGRPDVYTSVTDTAMEELKRRGLVEDYSVYLHNRLVLMIPEGNPLGIRDVADLGGDKIRVSQPGGMEDISLYISDMYVKAGGKELLERVTEEKRAEGTTLLTVVHHRETPLRITKGTADAGPVWATEVAAAKKQGLKVDALQVGPELDQHDKVNYFAARLTKGPNPENARTFIDFLQSETARNIYKNHGFSPHTP
jgi:ABC-type molybdate transport system substrate-binding protein